MKFSFLSNLANNAPYVIDKLSPLNGELRKKGYLQLASDGRSRSILELASDQLDSASKQVEAHSNGKNLIQRLDIDFDILTNYVTYLDKENQSFISEYLGSYKVDIAYTFVDYFDGEAHRNSQLWHHDSVGHRLKIFLSPDEISHAPTEIVEGTHLISHYGDYFWDKDKRSAYQPSGEVIPVATSAEVVNIIDTNLIHRGAALSKESLRRLVVIEVSQPLKSFCKGRIGRRKQP